MSFTIKKTYEFEAAHCINTQSEKVQGTPCKFIHGHSFKVEIELESNDVDSKTGMVVDFYFLNDVMRPLIKSLDHTLILHSEVAKDFRALKKKLCEDSTDDNSNFFCNYIKIVETSFPPTAENMAKFFYDYINLNIAEKEEFRRVRVKSVTFWETSKSCATFSDD